MINLGVFVLESKRTKIHTRGSKSAQLGAQRLLLNQGISPASCWRFACSRYYNAKLN